MPKAPTDRKPKAKAAKVYTFRHKGKTYQLPSGETVAEKIEGRYLRDAAMDGEDGALRLGFAMLEKVEGTPGAVEALYSMPAGEMMEHVFAWMNFKPVEDEPSVGESSASSD